MHPANVITEREVVVFRDMIQNSLKDRKAKLEAAEKLPPVPKPARKCKSCGLPLRELAACSVHSKAMRDYKAEFDYAANWSAKLSEATEEEYRLEEREKELLSVAESLKDNRDEESRVKVRTILGYDFRTAATKHLDRPDYEHKDGLIDVVRNRLAEIRSAMPNLVRAAQGYLDERNNVPSEGQIFQQRKKEQDAERILR
jgi:hypothetical protein